MSNKIDVLFSFDTTGSMYPCLAQVRNSLKETVFKLFDDIPDIRIGLIAHGDYCDAPWTITKMDFSRDKNIVGKFISEVQKTHGGDWPECYELVLKEAQSFSWRSDAKKVFVMIGDAVPHEVGWGNASGLDWRNESRTLANMGVTIHAVQCLGAYVSRDFYSTIARVGNGKHFDLEQLRHVVEVFMAVCYAESSNEQLEEYEKYIRECGNYDRSRSGIFDKLMNRGSTFKSKTESGLCAVSPYRFQILSVSEDKSIRDFVVGNGAEFRQGRGFYELTKSSKIQDYKEIIIQDTTTGDFFTGDSVRSILGIPHGTIQFNPRNLDTRRYKVFVQSTSMNRKLIGGTLFLYEVDEVSGI